MYVRRRIFNNAVIIIYRVAEKDFGIIDFSRVSSVHASLQSDTGISILYLDNMPKMISFFQYQLTSIKYQPIDGEKNSCEKRTLISPKNIVLFIFLIGGKVKKVF